MNALKFVVWLLRLARVPDLSDKPAVREWLKHLLRIAAEAAEATANQLDDTAVALLTKLVETDATWDRLYELLLSLAQRISSSEPIAMDAVVQEVSTFLTVGQEESVIGTTEAALDLGMLVELLLAIIRLLIELKPKD